MARRKRASPSPISIGNCLVEITGNGFEICDSSVKNLYISSSDGSKIKISVDDSRKYTTRKSCNNLLSSLKSQDGEGGHFPRDGHTFLLVNPKDVDSRTKCLLQVDFVGVLTNIILTCLQLKDIQKIYMEELPTMNYAANTGKESLFLERCISSGKYRTLILRSNSTEGLGEVIAAVSYQIIPSDTQYAEIPLAAVNSKYQSKGIGRLLYKELRERLQSVGILTIFCWADKESEEFWLKQGFIAIGEVDSKGKTRRLPIKADIRRALCFPGGSTLMVAHLNKDTVASVNSSKCSLTSHAKLPGNVLTGTALLENRVNDTPKNNSPSEHIINTSNRQIENTRTQQLMENMRSTDGASPCAIRLPCCANVAPLKNPSYIKSGDNLEVIENGYDTDSKHCSSGQRVKKRVWEASLSSLKSKRVRGGHLIDHCQDTKQDFACDHVGGNDSAFDDCSLRTSGCKLSLDVIQRNPIGLTSSGIHPKEKISGCVGDGMGLKGNGPRIMLMNIADDAKKTWLTKIVEELGGSVTCYGSACTHVITGKTRRTSNFCVALSSGAWIVSPKWLKASFKEGKFLGESQFLLEDEEYRLKYKSELRDAVIRAKENPHSLLRGYDVCLAKHIQPSFDVLSAIVKSAGGNVVQRLGSSTQEASRSIFVACEEDMEEAMVAARSGVWTFSSDWLMGCVMKQELDFEAPQFAESL